MSGRPPGGPARIQDGLRLRGQLNQVRDDTCSREQGIAFGVGVGGVFAAGRDAPGLARRSGCAVRGHVSHVCGNGR